MKKIALIGSHGTGKTTVVIGVKKEFGDLFTYMGEINRILVPQMGYERPRQIVAENGIATYIAAMIGTYAVIEERFNILKENKNILLDRSPVDFLGYYQVYLKRDGQEPSPFIYKLAKMYMDKIDKFFYFPTGVIPLVADDMRPGGDKGESNFQLAVDEEIKCALQNLKIEKSKIHHVQSRGIEERIKEVITLIKGVIK